MQTLQNFKADFTKKRTRETQKTNYSAKLTYNEVLPLINKIFK
jgi:hypothetical protein